MEAVEQTTTHRYHEILTTKIIFTAKQRSALTERRPLAEENATKMFAFPADEQLNTRLEPGIKTTKQCSDCHAKYHAGFHWRI